jgi:hypothetical protein
MIISCDPLVGFYINKIGFRVSTYKFKGKKSATLIEICKHGYKKVAPKELTQWKS